MEGGPNMDGILDARAIGLEIWVDIDYQGE